jgi:O-antigen/teichoic acid export membrane protein
MLFTKFSKYLFPFSITLVGALSDYVIRIILGRYYGPDVLGEFSYILSLSMILGSFIILGMHQGLNRIIPLVNIKESICYLKGAYFISFIAFVFVTMIVFLIDYDNNKIFYSLFIAIFFVLIRLQVSFFSALRERNIGIISQEIVNKFIKFFIFLLLINLLGEYSDFIGKSLLISFLLAYFIIQNIISRKIGPCNCVIHDKLKYILLVSLPLIIPTIAQQLNGRVEFLILDYYGVNLNDIGLYSASLSIAQIILIPAGVITFSLTANFVKIIAKKAKSKKIKKLILSKMFENGLISLLIVILFFLFGEYFIHLTFGREFLSIYKVTLILIISKSIFAITMPIINLLIGTGRARELLMISILWPILFLCIVIATDYYGKIDLYNLSLISLSVSVLVALRLIYFLYNYEVSGLGLERSKNV